MPCLLLDVGDDTWRTRVVETFSIADAGAGTRELAIQLALTPGVTRTVASECGARRHLALEPGMTDMIGIPLCSLPPSFAATLVDEQGAAVALAAPEDAARWAAAAGGWEYHAAEELPVYAHVPARNPPHNLTLTVWEPFELTRARPSIRRSGTGTARPFGTNLFVPVRGLYPAGSYIFDLLDPPSIRFSAGALEVADSADGSSGPPRPVTTITTRLTPRGPSASVMLTGPEIRRGRARMSVAAAPSFSSEWVTGPLVVAIECVAAAVFAPEIIKADDAAVIAVLALSAPAIAATVGRGGPVARRLFPQYTWSAWASYLVALALSGTVALKLSGTQTRRGAVVLAVIAGVCTLYNGSSVLIGKLRSIRGLGPVENTTAHGRQWFDEIEGALAAGGFKVDDALFHRALQDRLVGGQTSLAAIEIRTFAPKELNLLVGAFASIAAAEDVIATRRRSEPRSREHIERVGRLVLLGTAIEASPGARIAGSIDHDEFRRWVDAVKTVTLIAPRDLPETPEPTFQAAEPPEDVQAMLGQLLAPNEVLIAAVMVHPSWFRARVSQDLAADVIARGRCWLAFTDTRLVTFTRRSLRRAPRHVNNTQELQVVTRMQPDETTVRMRFRDGSAIVLALPDTKAAADLSDRVNRSRAERVESVAADPGPMLNPRRT